ncbi:hypothetical protein QF026_001023 [Streptomyces aurantiacus]|nr:hypothetical protein [Streptomyces aurantiacus]MDQ0772557.1 hypothetical protein [Streptomyces aurantiacus]
MISWTGAQYTWTPVQEVAEPLSDPSAEDAGTRDPTVDRPLAPVSERT